MKFFGITCELGSNQEYLDRRHRTDRIGDRGLGPILRASVRRRGNATVSVAKRQYLLHCVARPNSRLRNRLDEANAPVATMLRFAQRSTYPRSRRFLSDVLCLEHIRTARKWPARYAWRTAGIGRANSSMSRRLPLCCLPHASGICYIYHIASTIYRAPS